jgi:hypothetical protein
VDLLGLWEAAPVAVVEVPDSLAVAVVSPAPRVEVAEVTAFPGDQDRGARLGNPWYWSLLLLSVRKTSRSLPPNIGRRGQQNLSGRFPVFEKPVCFDHLVKLQDSVDSQLKPLCTDCLKRGALFAYALMSS